MIYAGVSEKTLVKTGPEKERKNELFFVDDKRSLITQKEGTAGRSDREKNDVMIWLREKIRHHLMC
jgi:hypothetical protein